MNSFDRETLDENTMEDIAEAYLDELTGRQRGGGGSKKKKDRPSTSKTSQFARAEAVNNSQENRKAAALNEILKVVERFPEERLDEAFQKYLDWLVANLKSSNYILDQTELKTVFHAQSEGNGGQNVNKVATAARVKHKPTKIVFESNDTSSQASNLEQAKKRLQAKLNDHLEIWRQLLNLDQPNWRSLSGDELKNSLYTRIF